MTNNEIQNKINELEKDFDNVKGTKCEVWSRVCGFYRPVSAFNPGKQQEYKERINYSMGGSNDKSRGTYRITQ